MCGHPLAIAVPLQYYPLLYRQANTLLLVGL